MQALKHAFVLKLSLKRISEAEELENLVNNLFSQEANVETVVNPVLQLLMKLKNFQTDTQPVLVIISFISFHVLLC